jgi:uncharacterized membrane protein
MITLVAGLIIFLGVHSVSIISEPWRDGIVAKMGLGPWKGLYSVLSLIGLILAGFSTKGVFGWLDDAARARHDWKSPCTAGCLGG